MLTIQEVQNALTKLGVKDVEFYSSIATRTTWFGFRNRKHFWVWFSAYNFETVKRDLVFSFDHSYNQNIGKTTKGIRRGIKFSTLIKNMGI